MTLNEVLDQLEKLGFVDDETHIKIIVKEGEKLYSGNNLFEVAIMVAQAKHYFGNCKVLKNDLCNEPLFSQYETLAFRFFLAQEE